MRAPRRFAPLLAVALVFTACSEANGPVSPRLPTTARAQALRSSGFIVLFKSGSVSRTAIGRSRSGAVDNTISESIRAAMPDAEIIDVVPSIGGVAVRGTYDAANLARANDVAAIIPDYEADIIDPQPSAADVVPLNVLQPTPSGTDQSSAVFFGANYQWDMKRISVNRVWAPSRGGAGANVCIIDSGIDAGHLDFTGKTIVSTSLLPGSTATTDTLGHGSHVSGTVSTEGIGTASTAPDASLMMVKIFDGSGGSATTTRILNGVQWCADNGADVISMSFGFTGGVPISGNEAFIAAFQAGMDYATNLGVLLVAAAGNDGLTLPVAGKIFLPAEAAGVTSVAATAPTTNLSPFGSPTWVTPGSQFDGIASYSNRGPVPSVDISAPGGDSQTGWPVQSLIISVCSRQFESANTFPCAGNGHYLFEAGTSMATPHVSGVAAIIRARYPTTPRSPTLRNRIEACLYKSVDVVGSPSIFGRGRLNAFKAATQPC